MTGGPAVSLRDAGEFAAAVVRRVEKGARLCGVLGMPVEAGTRLLAIVSGTGALATEEVVVPEGAPEYPSLTPDVPAAGWYERALHDLFGVEPVGHPRLDPLVYPVPAGTLPPHPGSGQATPPIEPTLGPLPAHVHGEGVFTIPHGPVRSGVFEAVEYLVETAGEDIPHVRARVFYKHRGLQERAAGMDVADGVLLAERMEGVASVAHALAYCTAVEDLAGAAVPHAAQLVRVVHAELERIANHLDTMVRHTEAAGQAVAHATLSHHKERVQRLRARLCGSRFGRGVVVPGGVTRRPAMAPGSLLSSLGEIERRVAADTHRLMATPSFTDRLRGTGVLSTDVARRFAVVGPVGRASGLPEDVRTSRPYAAYDHLGHRPPEPHQGGDALERQYVRLEEIAGAFHLVRQAADVLDELGEPPAWQVPIGPVSGRRIGWAEAPQGELLSVVEVEQGRLVHLAHRSASFHDLAAFASAFPKDILTDFAFIEASFGLSVAGAAG